MELKALPEALLPQTGLVQIIPTDQPGLSSQSSQACFPQAVSTAVLLAHPLGAIKHQTASLYLSPSKCLSPFASSNSSHSTPNSPHPHSLCFPRAQQPSPQELCTKRCLHAHIYPPLALLIYTTLGTGAWVGLYVLSSVWHRAEH